MTKRITITLAALCLCAVPLMGQAQPLGSEVAGLAAEPAPAASFHVWWSSVGDEHEVHFQLDGADGEAFAVLGAPAMGDTLVVPTVLGVAPLDDAGCGKQHLTFRAQPGLSVAFSAAYKSAKRLMIGPGPLPFGQDPICDTLDFDYTLGADWVMPSGQQISEQWSDIGMHVSARNAVVGKPDKAILFDSDVPSPHDPDLVIGEGQLLIIPEDDVDTAPYDGLVDVPNDAMKGGSLFFDFDMAYDLNRIRLADFDEPGSQLLFFRGGGTTTPDFVIDVPVMANGAVQTLTFDQPNVTRLEVLMAGSGAVVGVCGLPCPRVINFDESPFGRPLGFPPGMVVDNQFYDMGLGVRIDAVNGHWSQMNPLQNHPDKALLFDSDFPSGDDWDLFAQQGNILIIAEDDYDLAPVDGLVDDPDDEGEGGLLSFTLGRNVVGFRATIVDVDELSGPSELRCYDEFGVMIGAPIPLIPGPDGNIQYVVAEADGMRRLELEAQGSAALAELRYCLRDDR